MECLGDQPHSDILVRKVELIGQADLLDGRFARLASEPADLANNSEHLQNMLLLIIYIS